MNAHKPRGIQAFLQSRQRNVDEVSCSTCMHREVVPVSLKP